MKRPPNPLVAIIFVIAFSALGFCSAKNVYITPNGASQGSCTTNPQTPAWFNNSANWGSGGSQIGAGTTVLLCGTITTALTAHGSGASGSPITMTFDTGAAITLSVCPSSGCLNISGRSYIVVDGGTTCGWISPAVTSCNGTISSTASGSAYGNGATSSFVIEATNCAYCEIRNLNIGPAYVHSASTDSPAGDFRDIDQLGTTTAGATFLVHHNIIHDSASAVVYVPGSANDNGLQVYNNEEYNNNSCLDISNNDNGDITAALVHDNHCRDSYVWDTTSPSCAYHHNFMHSFAYTTTNSGIQFYNNLANGNWGGCPTSELFYEGSGSLNNNCSIFNNDFLGTYTQENNGVISVTCGGTVLIANNTIVGDLQSGDICMSVNLLPGATASVHNNIITSCNQLYESNSAANAYTHFDYNTWGGQSSGSAWAYSCGNSGCSYASTLAAWQSACSCDAHSTFGSSASYWGGNTLTGQLNSGSPAIDAGTNLTSLGITPLDSDQDGNGRPSGSMAWTEGAFNYPSGGAPAPPTGLAAVVD